MVLRRRVLVALFCLLGSCRGPDAERSVRVDDFVLDSSALARVVENDSGCIVDAECALALQFADTLVRALYGLGERATPPCEISMRVSDAAFEVRGGAGVEVVLAACGDEGVFIRRLRVSSR